MSVSRRATVSVSRTHRRFVRSRLMVVGASVAFIASGAVAIAVPSVVHAATTTPVTQAPDAYTAMIAAQHQNSKVLIEDETTSTSQTWANPDGTVTSQISAGPERFDNNGTWTDIDPTLQTNPDGTLSPAAYPQSIVLSGGGSSTGTQNLLSIGSGKTGIAWQWTGALPTPLVVGNRATYADVKPGIDLVVETRPTGVEQYFVLHNRPTAAVSLSLPLKLGSDVTPSTDSAGGIDYKDSAGDLRRPRHGRACGQHQGRQTSPTPPPPRRSSPLASNTSSATPAITIAPSLAALQNPATQYPVVIDPSVNLSTSYDTWIDGTSTSFNGGTWTTDYIGPYWATSPARSMTGTTRPFSGPM